MRNHSHRRLISEINVVPYVDVMLVLLVIFMITTPLLTQGVKVNLPHAQSQVLPPQQKQPLIVSINARGQLFLNRAADPQSPLSPQALATRVAAELTLAKRQHFQRAVLVKGDKTVAYGDVVRTMALLQQAGAGSVGLMTERE